MKKLFDKTLVLRKSTGKTHSIVRFSKSPPDCFTRFLNFYEAVGIFF